MGSGTDIEDDAVGASQIQPVRADGREEEHANRLRVDELVHDSGTLVGRHRPVDTHGLNAVHTQSLEVWNGRENFS